MVSPSKGGFHPDLEGAKGREVMFRPPRYDARELLGDLPMHVSFKDFDGRPIQCEIVNLSSNGLAFLASINEPMRNGERLREFKVHWGEDILYEGHASVTNQREQDGTLIVGCALKSGALDTETIQGLREKARVHSHLAAFRKEFHALFHSDIAPSYKAQIADMRLLLERYQTQLDALEASYQGLSKNRPRWERDVLEMVEPAFAEPFHKLVHQLYQEIRDLTGDARLPYRDYAQYQLHHLVMLAPLFHRAYHKPLGYAGDYQVLVWIYFLENHYEGNSLFAKLIHRMACTSTAGTAGIERIPYLAEKIRCRLEQHSSDEPLRVFSLASGPAKEIQDLLLGDLPDKPLLVTLFDQDEEALTYCHSILTPLQQKHQDTVEIKYLHSSVKQIIKDRDFVQSLAKQDMITSTGLFDYLPQRVAVRLLQNLVDMLKPGGQALIGNFQQNDTQFLFEYLSDWDLIYRSADEMLALTEGIDASLEAHIESERTGNNLFLVVQKP